MQTEGPVMKQDFELVPSDGFTDLSALASKSLSMCRHHIDVVYDKCCPQGWVVEG